MPLSDAVRDADAFPNLTRLHGLIAEILEVDLPADVLHWTQRFCADFERQPFRLKEIGEGIGALALAASPGPARRIARFAMFEVLCTSQRLSLRSRGPRIHPEAVFLPQHTVEVLAEHELDCLEVDSAYRDAVASTDDPIGVLCLVLDISFRRVGRAQWSAIQDELRAAVADVKAEIRRAVEDREAIFSVADHLPPDKAVLFRDDFAQALGGQPQPIKHLRLHHPLTLGALTDNPISQHRSGLRKKQPSLLQEARAGALEPRRGRSLGDVLNPLSEEV